MMRSVVESSLKLRFIVLALAAVLMVFGIAQVRHMPVDVLPEFTPPAVEIQTEALGLAQEEVEQLITVPLEQDLLNGVPWLAAIRSESLPGLSSIVLIFEPGTDLMRARQMVAERLTQAVALPHVSKPPTMLQPLSSTSRVMMVGLSSKDLSLIQMSVLARWTIAPRLMGIPGVANVAIWGQRDRQLQVLVDPQRLRDHDLPLLNVLETTANALWVSSLSFVEASTPGTGGFVDTANQRLGIRHILPIVSADGLAQIPIENTALKLGDVASVVEDHQPLIGDALTDGSPGLLLVIEKFPGANTLEVTQAVEQALEDMAPGLPGINADPTLYRPADFIAASSHDVGLALLIGFLLALLALAVLFFDWRPLLIGLVVIPTSLLAGVAVLYLRGATMNAIALVGLAMALMVVIDDTVIDVDNIIHRLRQHRREESAGSTARVVLTAVLETRGGVTFAMLIVLLAILPVFFVGGALGAFLQPLAVSYVAAVVAAMLVALAITPGLSLGLLAKAPLERRQFPLARPLQRGYEAALARIVRHPRAVVLLLIAVTAAGAAVLPLSRQSLLPAFKERNLLVHLNGAPGGSQPEMSRISGLISRELRSVPGVRSVAAQVGRAVLGDQVVDVNSAELWVSLDPGVDYDTTARSIKRTLAGYPGIHSDVQTYLGEKSSQVVAAANNSIVVRVYGDTTDVLRAQAEDVRAAIAGINGVSASHVVLPAEQPTVQIEVDLAAAQRYGVKPGDVRRTAATLLSGIQVGNLFEEQKVFDVVVWSAPATRSSLSSIRDLLIDTPSGGHVRLGDVAQVRVAPVASVIRHEAVKRYLDVIVDVRGRDLAAVAADAARRIRQMQFPLEYHAEVIGDFAAQQAERTRLLTLAAAAVIAMFFLMQAALGSWRLAWLSLLTLPSALAGGLVAVLVAGGTLSLGSLAGLLAVFGLAVRNNILLFRHYRDLERGEGEPFGIGLALRGGRERLMPILISALATALAFAPALVLGDRPGLEFVRPMAAVILGGLLTTTLLSLFVLPCLYLALGVRAEPALELASVAGAAGERALGGAFGDPAQVGVGTSSVSGGE